MFHFYTALQTFRVCISVFLCLLFHSALAQQDSLNTKPYHYLFTRNHFSVALENGLTRGRIAVIQGPDMPRQSYAVAHSLVLHYSLQASRHWAFSVSAGTGFIPFYVRVPYENWYVFRYWNDLEGVMHLKLGAEVNYRFLITKKKFTQVSAGVQMLKLNELNARVGGLYNDTANHPLYRYELAYTSNPLRMSAITLGIGQYKILRNYDLLGLTLSFQHANANFYNGYYQIADYKKFTNSRGTLRNNGNILYLGLRYTFTQAERQARYAKIHNKTGDTLTRSLRQKYKLRLQKPIAPHQFFVTASGVFVLQRIAMDDPNTVMGSALNTTIIPEIAFTLFGRKQHFLELRINRQEYYGGYRNIKSLGDCVVCGTFNSAFDAVAVGIGAGKRITTTRQLEILNLHAGLSLNFSNTNKGLSGWGSSSIRSGTDTLFFAKEEQYQKHKVFPLIYIGVSRDFRIRGKLYFSLAYRYYQGIVPVAETKIQYISQWTSGTQQALSTNYGSQHTMQFGLKYNLGKLY